MIFQCKVARFHRIDPAKTESCVPLLTECNQQGKQVRELENLEH